MMPVSFRILAKEMGVLSHHYHSLDVLLLAAEAAAVEVASTVVVPSCDMHHHQFVAVVADDAVEGHAEVEVEEISYHMLHLETLVGVHLRPPEKQHHRYLEDDEENASVAALDLDLDLMGRCILLRLLLLVLHVHREATSLIVIRLYLMMSSGCLMRAIAPSPKLCLSEGSLANFVSRKSFLVTACLGHSHKKRHFGGPGVFVL